MDKRIFVYNDHVFKDVDPTFTAEDVRRALVAHYPRLATAEVKETVRADGTVEIRFVDVVGDKG